MGSQQDCLVILFNFLLFPIHFSANKSLFKAAMSRDEGGDLAGMESALRRGADLDYVPVLYHGRTPLQQAALLVKIPAMRYLLRQGANPNCADRSGWTPLHLAGEYGQDTMISMLLEAGAEVDARDEDGWTPLMYAVRNGNTSSVRLLLEAGADLEATNNFGNTVGDLAGRPRHSTFFIDRQVGVREVLKEWREEHLE